jgi:hypothetical protein
MSAGFRAVQWNQAKLVYDSILLASVALYISSYLTLVYWLEPPKDLPAAIDLRIRAFGTCAFLMLTIILSIGPLARLYRRFLPLLYNRRHFGVLTFLIVFLHASFMVEWYAVQGALPSLLGCRQLDERRRRHLGSAGRPAAVHLLKGAVLGGTRPRDQVGNEAQSTVWTVPACSRSATASTKL